jgi:transmembrane sensor
MTDKDILALLKDERFCNYCLGKNEEDMGYWERWLDEHPEARQQVENQRILVMLLQQEIGSREIDHQFDALRHRIFPEETDTAHRTRQLYLTILKWAVAASLLLAAVTVYYNVRKDKRSLLMVKKTDQVISPGSNRAFLTLSNGDRIDLSGSKNGKLAVQFGSEVNKYPGGKLVYRPVPYPQPSNTSRMNILETPKGGQYRVTLPDGTLVYLNAESQLKYPSSFKNLSERKVQLAGEAFFEVKHDSAHPFIVETAKQTIKDIGTSFEVLSYRDEPTTKTTLVNGSVSVSSAAPVTTKSENTILKPGQEASIDINGELTVAPVDTAIAVAWRHDIFYFKNADIKSITNTIARWYDVEVVYSGNITTDRFNGKISRQLNLSQLLQVLESSDFAHFKLDGRKVTVFQ